METALKVYRGSACRISCAEIDCLQEWGKCPCGYEEVNGYGECYYKHNIDYSSK